MDELFNLWNEGLLDEVAARLVPLARLIAGEALRVDAVARTELDINDMVGIASEGLVIAVREWSPTHGVPIQTYASRRVRWFITQHLRLCGAVRRGGTFERVGSEVEDFMPPGNMHSAENEMIANIDLKKLLSTLPAWEHHVLERYHAGDSLPEIAVAAGYSRQWAQRTLDCARKKVARTFKEAR